MTGDRLLGVNDETTPPITRGTPPVPLTIAETGTVFSPVWLELLSFQFCNMGVDASRQVGSAAGLTVVVAIFTQLYCARLFRQRSPAVKFPAILPTLDGCRFLVRC